MAVAARVEPGVDAREGRATRGAGLGLAFLVGLILATRVLGLSLVLPGFASFGTSLPGGESTALVGFAFGAYAVSMAVLQVPFGMLSDRVGRRPVIAAGLLISAAGSFLAAAAPTALLLVGARLVQGAGAVNGVALALLGERTPPERRTTALAIAGAAIGVGFTAGLVAGAVLTPFLGVRGLFVLNGVLVLGTLVGSWVLLPREAAPVGRSASFRDVGRALAHPRVLALSGAAFATNLALHAVLFAFPLAAAGLLDARTAQFALAGAVIVGGLVMFGGARQADRGRSAAVGGLAALALGAGAAGVALAPGIAALVLAAAVFFAGQSVLAALLPSLAARDAPEGARGAAQSTLQLAGYAGVVLGGTLAGLLVGRPALLAAALAAPALLAAALLGAGARESARGPGAGDF